MSEPLQSGLPVSLACDLAQVSDEHKWLIEEIWAEQAVGILGGEPKCCKSFLALDIAVSVASGAPCLRQFKVRRKGPVLLFPAEDSLGVVRERLAGICQAAGTPLEQLPLYVITTPRLLLDVPQDQQRLRSTVEAILRTHHGKSPRFSDTCASSSASSPPPSCLSITPAKAPAMDGRDRHCEVPRICTAGGTRTSICGEAQKTCRFRSNNVPPPRAIISRWHW